MPASITVDASAIATFQRVIGKFSGTAQAIESCNQMKTPMEFLPDHAHLFYVVLFPFEAHIEWMEARRDVSAQQLVDDFVAANARWINQEAEELLASLEPDLLWKVIDYGSMQFCRDPKAIIKIRIKDAERGKVRAWKHKGNLLWLLHTFRDILPRACEGGKSGKKGSKFSGRTEPKWRSKEKNGREASPTRRGDGRGRGSEAREEPGVQGCLNLHISV